MSKSCMIASLLEIFSGLELEGPADEKVGQILGSCEEDFLCSGPCSDGMNRCRPKELEPRHHSHSNTPSYGLRFSG
jgi:hypothetical protein